MIHFISYMCIRPRDNIQLYIINDVDTGGDSEPSNGIKYIIRLSEMILM
jgi:hypothetical protein